MNDPTVAVLLIAAEALRGLPISPVAVELIKEPHREAVSEGAASVVTPLSIANQAAYLADDGLEVIDLRDNDAFAARCLHKHDLNAQMMAMQTLGRAFVDHPETLLQELVNAAVYLCGADSAGISMERNKGAEKDSYNWVATAGQYSGFLNDVVPPFPSACGICLERGTPQQFRVKQRFFDLLGVDAPLVTDGVLLPWYAGGARGTIFVMAHGRTEAFDKDDCLMMQTLASFAATGVRHLRQREQVLVRERNIAAVAMANHLAHKINNPLQSLVNVLYLAGIEEGDSQVHTLARSLSPDLQRLSELVAALLALPVRDSQQRNQPTARA